MTRAGHDLDPADVASSNRILRAGRAVRARPKCSARRSCRRAGACIRPKTLGQKAYVDAIDENTIVFGIGPAGTGKTYLAMAKAVQALQRKEVSRIILTRPAVEAGERLGFLPGTLNDKIDPYLRPLYDALNEMMDPEIVPKLMASGHDRGRAAGLHARPHAERLVRRARRGAEHDARADEDVPHPARVRHADGRHRRHHPGRPARRARRACGSSPACSNDIDDIHFAYLTSDDVVRHSLVGRIVDAYTEYDEQRLADRARARRGSRVRQTAPSGAPERPVRGPARPPAQARPCHDDRDQQRVRRRGRRDGAAAPHRAQPRRAARAAPMPTSRSCSSTRARWRRCTCSGWTSPARPTC